ncbi:hypothetical protein DL96DRAFT_915303 [Flagelloscypha sp. PMI_526]|nr:hypothetical protein DL96DRAFT_915303 [Flagelloscypha sp. PMI_526]
MLRWTRELISIGSVAEKFILCLAPYSLSVVVTLFISSTALWGLGVTIIVRRYQAQLLESMDLSLQQRLDAMNTQFLRFQVPERGLFVLNMIIGNSVMIWRTYVLWRSKSFILVAPLVLFAVSLSFSVISVVCDMQASFGVHSAIPGSSRACTWAAPLAWIFTLGINVLCTSLVAVKAWRRRSALRLTFSSLTKLDQLEKVAALIIESGLLFCIFWMFQLVYFLNISRDKPTFYFSIFITTTGRQITGIYPMLVIFLAVTQNTVHMAISTESSRASSPLIPPTPRFVTTIDPPLHSPSLSYSGKSSVRNKEISAPIVHEGYSIAGTFARGIRRISPRNWSRSSVWSQQSAR